MKRFAWLVFCVAAPVLGCGGGGGGTPDAGAGNEGFVPPDVTTKAYDEQGSGNWVEVGDADWSCLNTPSDDMANSVEITLNGRTEDFQTGDDLPNATVTVFDDIEVDNPFATATSDATGNFTMTIPTGHTRLGFKVVADGQMETLLLNQYLEPATATQTLTIGSVSQLTANALPAFIGVTRTPGRGVLAGAIRDCNNNEVGGAVATVSSTSGTATNLTGPECTADTTACNQTFYFSAGSTSLPTRHSLNSYTNTDGLFMDIELPVTTNAYLQVWGFTKDQDPAADDMTLLAEIPSPVFADTIVTFSLEPLRQ